jgi:hypothetical protein
MSSEMKELNSKELLAALTARIASARATGRLESRFKDEYSIQQALMEIALDMSCPCEREYSLNKHNGLGTNKSWGKVDFVELESRGRPIRFYEIKFWKDQTSQSDRLKNLTEDVLRLSVAWKALSKSNRIPGRQVLVGTAAQFAKVLDNSRFPEVHVDLRNVLLCAMSKIAPPDEWIQITGIKGDEIKRSYRRDLRKASESRDGYNIRVEDLFKCKPDREGLVKEALNLTSAVPEAERTRGPRHQVAISNIYADVVSSAAKYDSPLHRADLRQDDYLIIVFDVTGSGNKSEDAKNTRGIIWESKQAKNIFEEMLFWGDPSVKEDAIRGLIKHADKKRSSQPDCLAIAELILDIIEDSLDRPEEAKLAKVASEELSKWSEKQGNDFRDYSYKRIHSFIAISNDRDIKTDLGMIFINDNKLNKNCLRELSENLFLQKKHIKDFSFKNVDVLVEIFGKAAIQNRPKKQEADPKAKQLRLLISKLLELGRFIKGYLNDPEYGKAAKSALGSLSESLQQHAKLLTKKDAEAMKDFIGVKTI